MMKPRKFITLLISLLSTTVLAQSVTQIGRYTTVVNTPTQAQLNPLLAVSQFKFNDHIKTVGDAVTLVLENSGYQLAPKEKLSNEVIMTLMKPLPITERNLGPLTIQDCLLVLMGQSVFNLTSDPLQREVNFKLKHIAIKKPGVQHGNH